MSEKQQRLIVSSSPHVHSGDSVRNIMLTVLVALGPAMASALAFFQFDALRLTAACVITCVLSEALCRRMMGRDYGVSDLSAVVTGVLLAFNLPPALPTWMAVAGSVFAIVVAKQLFGGIGYNPFNPALMGRIFLLISFPAPMTTWSQWHVPAPLLDSVQAVTTATPLGLAKTTLNTVGEMLFGFNMETAVQFFNGNMNGCIGETSALALLIGGVYLIYRRCIYWQVPVSYIGTVVVFSGILWILDPSQNYNPVFHVLAGGLMIGAFFMATDMVTTPVTKTGMIIFGVGCGILTMVIRKWGGYPEGVSFSIVLMNAVTPLINRAVRPRVFGHKR